MVNSVAPALPTARDARPLLGFRLGVINASTWVGPTDPALRPALEAILDDIAALLTEFAGQPAARSLYRDVTPVPRLVSRLAAGAECLAAELAVVRHWRLAVALPFLQPSVQPPPALLREAAGEVVELDGSENASAAAWLQAGLFVLRHSDVIIVVADTAVALEPGEIGELVMQAQSFGIPVIHIEPGARAAPRFILPDAGTPGYKGDHLANMIRRVVLPTWPRDRRDHQRAAEIHFLGETLRESDIEADFLYSGPFARPDTWFSWVFKAFQDFVAGPAERALEVPPAPAAFNTPAVRMCFLHFQRADALATHYAGLHRSVFVLIYLLGSASLAAAFTAQYAHGSRLATVLEGLALLMILNLYRGETLFRWRERWLDGRSLAELLRQADLLLYLGYPPTSGCLDHLAQDHPERGWVPWLVAAIIRSAGVVGGRHDEAFLIQARDFAVHTRLADQIDYHHRTEQRNEIIARYLRNASFGFFFATMAAIALEFAPGDPTWPALLAGIFPALGAAIFGIRNQAEFEIVVGRSARLHRRLRGERDKIAGLAGARLTAARLGEAVLRTARLMQNDAVEWAAIFEVKESEVV